MYDRMYWWMHEAFREGEFQQYDMNFTEFSCYPNFDDAWGMYCMGGEL